MLLKNYSTEALREGFLTVRPAGGRGVTGATIVLRDAQDSRILACGKVGGVDRAVAQGPPECSFGVGGLSEALVEVLFSDGLKRSVRWTRHSSPGVLVVGRAE